MNGTTDYLTGEAAHKAGVRQHKASGTQDLSLPAVRADGVTWRLEGRAILDDVDLAVPEGAVCGVLGPNGSGKSSLLRCLFGALQPTEGTIQVGEHHVETANRRDLARHIAVVLQHGEIDPGTTVAQVVELGRLPHQGLFGRWGARDTSAVERARTATDICDLWERTVETLSGGERQRVHVARALAQEPAVLMLDEPTNHLDLLHQEQLLQLVRRLKVTTVVVLHDLSLAMRMCDSVLVLQDGRERAKGPPVEALNTDLIGEVWGVRAELLRCSTGDTVVAPTGTMNPQAGNTLLRDRR